MGLCIICGHPESNDECCRNQPCRECDKLKARVERLTKVLTYVEGALASSEEPWLREAHGVIKKALAEGDDSLAEQEGK